MSPEKRARVARLPVAVQMRLAFIDEHLERTGHINRSHLIEAFRISLPQASHDMTSFRRLFSKRTWYDLSAKQYCRRPKVGPGFSREERRAAFEVARVFGQVATAPVETGGE